MKNETIIYTDGPQKLVGELFYQENIQSPQAAILVFPAFEGRGEFALNYAKKLAEKGFISFVVDMYGDARVETTIEGCFERITPFLENRMLVRHRAKLAFQALGQHRLVDKAKIGAVGFCFGGMCLLELARSGENLHAGVSMHGVLKKSNLPTHPISTKLLVLHGYKDPQVPPENLQAFAQEMEEAGANDWTFTFFGHAKHSFTDSKTGSFNPLKEKEMGREYDQMAAHRSFQYSINFLNEMFHSQHNPPELFQGPL